MISDRLRDLRIGAGLSMEQMGAIAGTSKQGVNGIEKGRVKEPSPVMLATWAAHFGVRTDWLILGKPPKESAESQLGRLTGAIILAAYQEAIAKYEHSTGLNATSFHPFEDEDDAALLASCIVAQLSADGTISSQVVENDGSTGANRSGSAVAGKDRPAEARGESKPAHRQRKKSAA